MSIGPKTVKLTADVLRNHFIKIHRVMLRNIISITTRRATNAPVPHAKSQKYAKYRPRLTDVRHLNSQSSL